MVAASAALSVAACSPSSEEIELAALEANITELESDERGCDSLRREEELASARHSQAVWDRAAAEVVDEVSPAQEEEIRISLGAELGIAPSKVDWKNIYKRRAEQAKAEEAQAATDPAASAYDGECADRWTKSSRLEQLRKRAKELSAKIEA